MRKKLCIILTVILLLCTAFACWVIFQPNRYYVSVDSGLSKERILKEMPDLEITADEYVLAEALAALPEVQKAAETEGVTTFDPADFEGLFSAYLPELLEDEEAEFSVMNHGGVSMTISFEVPTGKKTSAQRTYLSFGLEKTASIYKVIGTYRVDKDGFWDNQAVYENRNNEKYVKWLNKRDWFAFLREQDDQR